MLAAALRNGDSQVVFEPGPGEHNPRFWDARMDEVMAWAVARLNEC